MKPRRPTSFTRETPTTEPDSSSVSRPEWSPETQQTPIIQPDPGPERTLTDHPGSKMLQEFDTPQKQSLQQEPIAQQEVEFQQGPRVPQKPPMLPKVLTPVVSPAPQQQPPTQDQQEATFHWGPEAETVSTTQQEPPLREERAWMTGSGPAEPPQAPHEMEAASTAQAGPGPQEKSPAQIYSPSQERLDPTTQQTPLVQANKPKQGSLMESGFLTRLHDLSIHRTAQEWKTFFDWITESDTEEHLSSSSKSNLPEPKSETVIAGTPLPFKMKPDYENMPGYSGKSPQGMRTNHKHSWDTASAWSRSCLCQREHSLPGRAPPRRAQAQGMTVGWQIEAGEKGLGRAVAKSRLDGNRSAPPRLPEDLARPLRAGSCGSWGRRDGPSSREGEWDGEARHLHVTRPARLSG
ncbi:hormone-sensitive lipase-like [Phodopus roborovskii]|uniref:hormone-sensitive lipase-like n=1 Tax=Phodopus roborovskii TaxID=109678 RepID=UPI0021E38690|nr:hormone-sensitive lipase-like [Phodopus roborovskii]